MGMRVEPSWRNQEAECDCMAGTSN